MPDKSRLKITVRGAVQGVGFRPFVYRLATELGLQGWVNNSAQGVFIEIEGVRPDVERFLLGLEAEKPPHSFIQSLESSWLDPVGYSGFEIRPSDTGGAKTALVLPDIATCPDCLREIFASDNRRYFYPFTNCTNCGPRFSIIEALPYDRPNTSMKRFTMCPECQAEYDNPRNRRFHAQPNACPVCGPRLELWDREGKGLLPLPLGEGRGEGDLSHRTLTVAAEALRQGKILAVKGLGGFHLMVAAHNDEAVRRLRELKHREEKPFALMFPSLDSIKAACEVAPLEARLLRSSEAPIVLLCRRVHASRSTHHAAGLPNSLAPNNPYLGVMLPYTPLHHLLLSLLGFPVVATSGNLSDEPICTDEGEALERLGGIADFFLVHNRPIVRHVDDSIVRVMAGRELVLRRARGYAPLPIQLPRALDAGLDPSPKSRAHTPQSTVHGHETETQGSNAPDNGVVLAVGAHLKNAVALAVGSQVFISQHIGDLETDAAYEAFRRVISDFETLYESRPSIIVADAHPDYLSTKFAHELAAPTSPTVPQASPPAGSASIAAGNPVRSWKLEVGSSEFPAASGAQPSTLNPQLLTIQHHVAHVLSCMAENELAPPVLGVSWDGTGYGLDGTVWGGEFFLITDSGCERVAHLRPFPLPGGEQSIKEPRRTALGLLFELFGGAALTMSELAPVRAFSGVELAALETMLTRGLNSPRTSSIGRLFDAVAALTGLRQQVRFEGQAAMELEFALDGIETDEAYPLPLTITALPGTDEPPSLDSPSACLVDSAPLVRSILADLKRQLPVGEVSARFHNALVEALIVVARRASRERVVLSGGCFQNCYLTEHAVQRLRAEGFQPYWHQRVPPNDGGIALGQVVAARGWSARF